MIFQIPDKFNFTGTNYNIDNYTIYLYMTVDGSKDQVEVHHDYAHTWKTTSISGFGLAVWGLNVSWTTNSNGWKATAGPKYW